MYNGPKEQPKEQGQSQEFLNSENFFERQGMMPDNNSDKIIGEALKEQKAGDEIENWDIAGTDENVAMPIEDVSPMAGNEAGLQGDDVEFSHHKEFTSGDGKITEAEIKRLMEDPGSAYEEIQSDKEEYLKNKFGRIFGEQK